MVDFFVYTTLALLAYLMWMRFTTPWGDLRAGETYEFTFWFAVQDETLARQLSASVSSSRLKITVDPTPNNAAWRIRWVVVGKASDRDLFRLYRAVEKLSVRHVGEKPMVYVGKPGLNVQL